MQPSIGSVFISTCARNAGFAKLTRLIFLHGNVAVGYCSSDRVKGPGEGRCPIRGRPLTGSRLLYPIKQKDYKSDSFISSEWKGLRSALRNAYVFTIFGYSAPDSVVEAISLLKEDGEGGSGERWNKLRSLDTKAEADVREIWDAFIVEHRYDTEMSFYDSWIARHPRGSCDAVWRQTGRSNFFTDNPIPQLLPSDKHRAWYQELVDAEPKSG